MKDLLIVALGDAYILLEKQVPKTKIQAVYVNIEHVRPIDLIQFMKDNGIPEDADFAGKSDRYDTYCEACLCYDIEVATTAMDQLKFKVDRFQSVAWSKVYPLLKSHGYRRRGFNSGLLKQFDNTTVYDMFVSGDFDRLVKYYSLPFTLES